MQSQGSLQGNKSVREIWRGWTAGFEAEGNGPEPRNAGGLRWGEARKEGNRFSSRTSRRNIALLKHWF